MKAGAYSLRPFCVLFWGEPNRTGAVAGLRPAAPV